MTTTAAALATMGPFDLGTQAGIIAGGFFFCLIATATFAMAIFGMISCKHCSCCSGLPAVGESCLFVFMKWAIYKYCPWCCKNYKRKLEKQMERLKREEEEMEFEMMKMEEQEEKEGTGETAKL